MFLDRIGTGANSVISACSWVRPHIDSVLLKSMGSIQKKSEALFDELANLAPGQQNVSKQKIEDLTGAIQANIDVTLRNVVGAALGCYIAGCYIPFFSTVFKVGAIWCALIAYDLNQMHHAAVQLKKWVKNSAPDDAANWNVIKIELLKFRAQIQSNTIFLSRSIFYGKEMELFVDFIERKIEAGSRHNEIKWVPDQYSQKSLEAYIQTAQENLARIIMQKDKINASELYEIVKEIERPFAFARAAGIASALALYLLSAYLPLFSSLVFAQACVVAFFAWEFHQIHESIRSEMGEFLFQKWDEKLTSKQLVQKVKDSSFMIQESSLIVKRFFSQEIERIPGYIEEVANAKGEFEKVFWVDGSPLQTLLGIFETLNIFTSP